MYNRYIPNDQGTYTRIPQEEDSAHHPTSPAQSSPPGGPAPAGGTERPPSSESGAQTGRSSPTQEWLSLRGCLPRPSPAAAGGRTGRPWRRRHHRHPPASAGPVPPGQRGHRGPAAVGAAVLPVPGGRRRGAAGGPGPVADPVTVKHVPALFRERGPPLHGSFDRKRRTVKTVRLFALYYKRLVPSGRVNSSAVGSVRSTDSAAMRYTVSSPVSFSAATSSPVSTLTQYRRVYAPSWASA